MPRGGGRTSNVYAADGAGMLDGPARHALDRVYVPNSQSNTVDVIDPRTYKVVHHFAVGALPQHVVAVVGPRALYVLNDIGNSLTPHRPAHRAGRAARSRSPTRTTSTSRPTAATRSSSPSGCTGSTSATRTRSRCSSSVNVPCAGVDHMDFSADGRAPVASCEFSGQLVEVDVEHRARARTLTLPGGRRRCRRTSSSRRTAGSSTSPT